MRKVHVWASKEVVKLVVVLGYDRKANPTKLVLTLFANHVIATD